MSFGAVKALAKKKWAPDLEASLALSAGKKLTITPTVTGNQRQFTVMMNVKRAVHGTTQYLLSGGTFCWWLFNTDDTLRWGGVAGVGAFTTARKFRDTGWMFIGLAVDTVAQTIKMVVNDEEITSWTSQSAPTLNINVGVNLAGTAMQIGGYAAAAGNLESLISDIVLLDGTVLTPAEMIAYRTRLIPFGGGGITTTKKFDITAPHTFGTNGCQLLFDNLADLGESLSGNTTSWSLTGITSADQTADVPGREYCILNYLDKGVNQAISKGGLGWTNISTTWNSTRGTLKIPAGKFYFEAKMNDIFYSQVGVGSDTLPLTGHIGVAGNGWCLGLNGNLRYDSWHNNTFVLSYITPPPVVGDVVQVAVDTESGKIWFGVNGSFNGDPATGSGEAYSGLSGVLYPMVSGSEQAENTINFGQKAFNHTPPAGFKSLSTDNLPTTDAPADPDTGSFTGNANANGPFDWLGYAPALSDTLTINGNVVTWGTHADALSTGFKLRTSSATYNSAGTNTYSIVTTNAEYGGGRAPWPLAR